MSSAQNQSHPRLTIDDMTPERIVVMFTKYVGASGPFTIVEAPEMRAYGTHRALAVPLRNVNTGETTYISLSDLGVTPYEDGSWNDMIFLVDYKDHHLLPTVPVSSPMCWE